MNTKNKILAVLIMSLLVFGGGGAYLYNQFEEQTQSHYNFTEEIYFQQPEIIPQTQISSGMKSSKRKIKSLSNEILPEMGVTLSGTNELNALASSSGSNRQLLSRNSAATYKSTNEEPTLFSSGSSSLMAYGGIRSSSSSSKITTNGSSGGNYSSTSISGPLMIPFEPTNPNTTISLAAPDPGTESNMTMITPVGEGWWILLLLGVGYALYRRKNII